MGLEVPPKCFLLGVVVCEMAQWVKDLLSKSLMLRSFVKAGIMVYVQKTRNWGGAGRQVDTGVSRASKSS